VFQNVTCHPNLSVWCEIEFDKHKYNEAIPPLTPITLKLFLSIKRYTYFISPTRDSVEHSSAVSEQKMLVNNTFSSTFVDQARDVHSIMRNASVPLITV